MLHSKEGQRVPEVTFRTRQDNQWVDVTSTGLFGGRKVVLFALPGAFTPTCSSSHLPRYNELVPVFRRHGIDDVICLSVNDAFVMNAWQAEQGAGNVSFIPDGNGEFTQGMGMLVDKSELGFGRRSWRYSMLVTDGVIEKMFIEPELPGDPFQVSDADTMLCHVAPGCELPARVTVITKPGCPYCVTAKETLRNAGMHFEEIELGRHGLSYSSLQAITGRGTTPQIFVDGTLVGGSEELANWLRLQAAA